MSLDRNTRPEGDTTFWMEGEGYWPRRDRELAGGRHVGRAVP
jgi:hypothetical protein